jgi:SAM-dependent methyltransferase
VENPVTVRVRVEPVPTWVDRERLLGPGVVASTGTTCELTLPMREAADLAARLRGLGIAGAALEVSVEPPLPRALVRDARLRDARARRATTPGFTRREARASGEGRFSLTPEVLALRLGELAQKRSVVDACCGSGGNTLGFARAGCAVTAIELDAGRLAEARHNASVYRVQPRFLAGDALALVSTLSADILFVDPPWGEDYDKKRSTLRDFPLLAALLQAPLTAYGELWLKLPASFAVDELPDAQPSAWFGEAEGDRHRIKFLLLRLSAACRARTR